MERKTIGLALSGGGARGFAHVGVLQAFAEHGIEIDMVAGSSAGSFVGGAYAAGLGADRLAEIGQGFNWFSIAGFAYSPRGLLTTAPMTRFIEQNFPVTRFEDLRMPFAAVACDLQTGNEVIMKETGDLATAIRASCAIPAVFVPVEDSSGRQLVDGGVVSPMPTRAVKKLGADIVIAVDLLSCGTHFTTPPSTLVGTFIQSAMMLVRTASKHQHYRANIVIEPQIAHIRPDEMKKMDELMRLGREAALEKVAEIKALLEKQQ